MLTAAVRDLHRCHPGEFLTDVRTSCPALWEHNPWLTPLDETDRDVQTVECHYPLIHRSNAVPKHFLHGFIEFLNERLGLSIALSQMSGDVHLSDVEKSKPSAIHTVTGVEAPYWLLIAGGKYDYTIKWWHHRRFQEVVNYFQGKLLFVQVGEAGHFHPRLSGVLDQRGKTTLRQLVQWTRHADGAVCPVTFLMHLAAAVPVSSDAPAVERPCVVIAGGREPVSWEAYPGHDFLHTIGQLPCCATGGCWRSRTVPLGDGDPKDQSLCEDVAGNLPRCMDMIDAGRVIESIERHIRARRTRTLRPAQARALRPFLNRTDREEYFGLPALVDS